MYLLANTDFVGDTFVPNLDEARSKEEAAVSEVTFTHGQQLLQSALGYELYKDLSSNITDGVLSSEAPQKWLDFVNGVEYTAPSGRLVKWNGVRDVLRYYCYFHYIQEAYKRMTGTGAEAVIDVKNAVVMNPSETLVATWNKFLQHYQPTFLACGPRVARISGVLFTDYYNGQQSDDISLLRFLADKSTDYPNPNSTTYQTMNQWGL